MFDNRYEVILADTAEARQIHYNLRYQVYCLEEEFESREAFPDQMERDTWDDNSVHFIVRCKETMEWLAAMRLVLPRQERLPLQNLCEIDSRVVSLNQDANIAEVSRICIKDTFRRNIRSDLAVVSETGVAPAEAGNQHAPARQKYKKSEIMLGLLRAASVYSRKNNISNWYFLTTPALARLMNQMNIQLIKIGSACMHRGKRYPFMADLKDSEGRLKRGCDVVEKMLTRIDLAYSAYSALQPDFNHMAA